MTIKLYDPCGKLHEFASYKEAAEEIGVTYPAVYALCNHLQGTVQTKGWACERKYAGRSLVEERKRHFVVYDGDGKRYAHAGIREFCRERGLNPNQFMRMISGHLKSSGGFSTDRDYAIYLKNRVTTPSGPCVYAIRCLVTRTRYIGMTTNFLSRKAQHLRDLREGFHGNLRLQQDYEEYGDEAFRISPIRAFKRKSEAAAAEEDMIVKLHLSGARIYNNCWLISDEEQFNGKQVYSPRGELLTIDSALAFRRRHKLKWDGDFRKMLRGECVERHGWSTYPPEERERRMSGENEHNKSLEKHFRLRRADGKILACHGVGRTAKLMGVKKDALIKLLRGERKSPLRGFTLAA